MSPSAIVAALVFIAAMLVSPVLAFSAAASGLFVQHFDSENSGLPSNAIQQSLTDRHGFLWVATDQGLARFDGALWRVWDGANSPAMVGNEVVSLAECGAVLFAMQASGRLLQLTPHNELKVVLTLENPHELRCAGGALYAVGLTVERIHPALDAHRHTLVKGTDLSKAMLLIDWDERFLLLDDQAQLAWLDVQSGQRQPITQLAPSAGWAWFRVGKTLWLHNGAELVMVEPESATVSIRRLPYRSTARMLHKGPDGQIWYAAANSEFGVCRAATVESLANCAPVELKGARNITDLHLDPHGALWVSSFDRGLFRITAPPIARIAEGRITAFAQNADGEVYFHNRERLFRADGKSRQLAVALQRFDWATPPDPHRLPRGLLALSDGRLLRAVGDQVETSTDFVNWLPLSGENQAGCCYAAGIDPSGRIWSGGGLRWHADSGRWRRHGSQMGLSYGFSIGPDRAYWAASMHGIFRLDQGGRWQPSDAPQPEGRFTMMSTLTDRRGHVWFGGYQNGLYRFDGQRWLRLTVKDGLPDDTGYGLVDDAQGRLWVSHGRGLYTLQLDSVDHYPSAPLQIRRYGAADGLPVAGFNGGSGLAALRDSQGMLWFGSDDGAIRLDPQRLPVALAAPTVLVESIRVDGSEVPLPPAGERLQFAAGVSEVQFALRAPLPGVAARADLQYRLLPLQTQWQRTNAQSEVLVQRLPAGVFDLQVRTAIDGNWRAPRTLMRAVQLPFWWQQTPYRALLTVLALVALMWGVRWRFRQLAVRNDALEVLVANRSAQLAQAELEKGEAQRALTWHQMRSAHALWFELDAGARLVVAAVAQAARPIARSDLCTALAQSCESWWPALGDAAITHALERAKAAGVIDERDDTLALARGELALLPDLQSDLGVLAGACVRQIGGYQLLEKLGEGGMGEVYRARSNQDGSAVALKLMHRDLGNSGASRKRFEQEGAIVATLRHPHIVHVHARGETDGRLYLVMALLEGESLGSVMDTGAIALARAIAIVNQLRAALSCLHDAKVVHRDLHPGNVFLGANDYVTLLDFGLARSVDHSALTRDHALLGSLQYLAPELLTGGRASAATDCFALGVIAYQLYTGKRLWQGEQTVALIAEIAQFPGLNSQAIAHLPMELQVQLTSWLSVEPRSRALGAFVDPISN